VGSLPVVSLHTQLPPVSDRMEAWGGQQWCGWRLHPTYIYRNDIGHGKKGGQSSTYLSGELGVFDFLLLEACQRESVGS
jgi:hypothetical protein